MKYGTLNKRNASCDVDLLRRYEALYRGGPAFKKLLPTFLPKNVLESTQSYTLRCREAYYRSYVGPIVDFFAAQLFGCPFLVRATQGDNDAVTDEFYSAVKEDVDQAGTDLTTFMKSRFITSLVTGQSWWLAELPDDGGQPADSREDWASRGLGRVRLSPIETDAVVDYECDRWGALQWIITYDCEYRRDDPRQDRNLRTETWRLFDKENVETFTITYDPAKKKLKPEDEIPSLGKVPHRFPRVPLVQMALPDGLWLMNRVADAQLEHFRLSSALSWSLKRTAYPMLAFKSASVDEGGSPKPPTTGAGFVHCIGTEEEFAWVSPPATSFDVLAKEIATQKDEIYRVAQQMAHGVDNNAAAMGRSGESKAADQTATEICLLAYASVVKAAIEETFELISDGREDYDVHFSVEGMDAYNLDAVSATLANIEIATKLNIPSPTLKREMHLRAAQLLVPDASQEVKDTIREEITKAADEPQEPKQEPVPPMAPQPPITMN